MHAVPVRSVLLLLYWLGKFRQSPIMTATLLRPTLTSPERKSSRVGPSYSPGAGTNLVRSPIRTRGGPGTKGQTSNKMSLMMENDRSWRTIASSSSLDREDTPDRSLGWCWELVFPPPIRGCGSDAKIRVVSDQIRKVPVHPPQPRICVRH